MNPRYVVVEFRAGPLDGFHNGWTTDENVVLPEKLSASDDREWWGNYFLRHEEQDVYIYQWSELWS